MSCPIRSKKVYLAKSFRPVVSSCEFSRLYQSSINTMKLFEINKYHISGNLVKEIKEGNEHSFKLLFTTLWNPLLNFTFRIVKDVQIAENILQDIFAHLWQNRQNLDEEGNLKSYLYTSAKNKALNHLKRPDTYFESTDDNEYLLNDEVTERVINEELETAIDKAIDSLPEKCKMIFKMNKNDKLTYKEIADILNISQKTVETQMSRALKKLRIMLAHLAKVIIFIKIFFHL